MLGTAVVADVALAVMVAADAVQASSGITTAGTITAAAFAAVGVIVAAGRRE